MHYKDVVFLEKALVCSIFVLLGNHLASKFKQTKVLSINSQFHVFSTVLVVSALVNNIIITDSFTLDLLTYKTLIFRSSFFIYAIAINVLTYALKHRLHKKIIQANFQNEQLALEKARKLMTFLTGLGIVMSPVLSGLVYNKLHEGGVSLLLTAIIIQNSILLAFQK